MSQEYPLSASPQAYGDAQANGDFWTQNGGGILASAGIAGPGYPGATPGSAAKISPMKRAHRLLRGRYPLVILLAAMGAVAGGVAGYMAVPPKYEYTGAVAVNPYVNVGGPTEGIVPMVMMFISAQANFLTSPSVAATAIQDPDFIRAWQEAYGTAPLPLPEEMAKNALAEHKGQTFVITFTFDDRKKEVAAAGGRAMLKAYQAQHGNGEFESAEDTMQFLQNDLAQRQQQLNTYQQQLDALGSNYDTTDLTARDTAIQQELATYEAALVQAKSDLERAEKASQGTPIKKTADPELVYQKIAAIDRLMQVKLDQREAAEAALTDASLRFGPKNPNYIIAQQRVQDAHKSVDDYAKQYLVGHGDMIPYELADALGMPVSVQSLKDKIESTKAMIADRSEKAKQIGAVMSKIADVRRLIADAQLKEEGDQHTIDALIAKKTLTVPIKVIPGGEPVLASDKRKFVAALGFGFGGLVPLGLILLYGMTENRFRYSDDASPAELLGVTMLGILPNLPDRLSDPQQAGIAAHCVHQIRTMLQISRSNDEPQVIAITSAASGDGKTSLTLALGLSYAACGARTLLVDCDLIAAGLTHRLNVTSTEGVLEAVANRALLEYVRTTDIADVAVLPVGTTHAHHASTLSPVALRRLLSEAKKHFDLIIIDTGPILGSIEASLVCAASDRTILAVARNQQRPLVEKSISHLQAIGAQLAGVVFNRAQASDFERSMSGLALRSRPLPGSVNATPSQTTAAKNVAGSFKRAG